MKTRGLRLNAWTLPLLLSFLPVGANGAECGPNFAKVLGTDSKSLRKQAGPRRFTQHLERLAETIESEKDAERLIDAFMRDDLRASAFKAEELGRVYRGESKEMEKFFLKFKGFEDALGKVDEAAADLKFLESLKPTAKQRYLHGQLTTYARGRLKAKREAFGQFLVREGWTDAKEGGMGDALERAVKWLKESDWERTSKDRKIFLRAMDEHLKMLGSNPYDMNVLQGKTGIHQLRRDIRKFLIQAQAADGLVLVRPDKDVSKLPARTQELLKAFSTPEARKYVTFPPNEREKNPAQLRESNVVWTSEMVKRIGDVKEYGEAEEALVAAVLDAKITADPHTAHELVQPFLVQHPKYDPKQPDIHERARRLFEEFKAMQIVEGLRKDLKKALR